MIVSEASKFLHTSPLENCKPFPKNSYNLLGDFGATSSIK
jgi:hypothetical protein